MIYTIQHTAKHFARWYTQGYYTDYIEDGSSMEQALPLYLQVNCKYPCFSSFEKQKILELAQIYLCKL